MKPVRDALTHSALAVAAVIELMAGSAQAAPPVTDGLVLALDASAITGLSDGAQVNTWTDTSTSANNAIATGSAATYQSGVLNGHPVVRFSGDGEASFNFTEISTIQTVFWVVKKTSSGLHFLLGDSDVYNFHQGDSTIWSSDYASDYIQNGTTKLMGTEIDGTATSLPADSFQLISLVTTGDVRANQLSLDRDIGGRSWVGDMAEILIYDRALTTEEETLVGLYLTAKYGLTTAYRPLGPPSAPTGLVATSLHLGVRLDWTASTVATGYKVERLTGTGGTIDATYDASGTFYTDTTVTTGGPYFYVVRAVNSLGTGLPSAEASASPSADPVNQTLTFALGSAVTKSAADAPFADTASAFLSGLPVTYSSDNFAVATVDASSGEVTLGVPGTVHILADAAGNADFNAATQVSQTLTVTQVTTVLTWATPAPIQIGTPLSGTQLNASSGGVDGEFVYTPSIGTALELGTHTLSVQFTPTNTVKYSSPAAKTVQLVIHPPATLVIYEPFAGATGPLNGQAAGTGLSGTWGGNDQINVTAGSLSFGSLLTSGNHVEPTGISPDWWNNGAGVNCGTTLSNFGLLAPGAELWFSCLVKSTSDGSRTYFCLGDTAADGWGRMGNAGGVGFQMDHGTVYAYPGNWAGGWGGPKAAIPDGVNLIVGKITWGPDSSTSGSISIYLPGTDLALPATAASTQSTDVKFDPSTFNTISFANGQGSTTTAVIDEIRFGARYIDVVPADAPSGYPSWASSHGLNGTAGSSTDPAFFADPNKDGVANGLVWLIGGTTGNPLANSSSILPVPSDNAGKLLITFKCLKSSARGTANLYVEYSEDLGGPGDPWQGVLVPDANLPDSGSGVGFVVVPIEGSNYNNVTATIAAPVSGSKLFGRLMATEN